MSELRAFVRRLTSSDFVRHGLLVFGALMAANALLFLFYSAASRIVGVERYGVITSLMSGILLLASAPALVVGTIVARLAADLRAVGDTPKLRRLGDVVTGGSAVIGAVAFGVTVLCAPLIEQYLHLTSMRTVLLAGLSLGISYAVPVQRGVLQGMEDFNAYVISNIVEAGAKFVAGAALGVRFGTDGVLLGLFIGNVAPWCYDVLVLRRCDPKPSRLRLDIRRIAKTSANVGIAVLAVNALLFYDVILVRHYFSPLIAGLFGATSLVGRAVYAVIAFVPTIVLPKASARRIVGRRTTSLLLAALATGGGIVAAALIAVAVAPRLVVSILAGHAFADAAPFELPYVFAVGALALTNVVVMYKVGLHRFEFVVPLAVVAIGEIGAVSIWHASIEVVLVILCAGHALSLAATLVGVGAVRPIAPEFATSVARD
jgi:O-antigen/teichoic acid export membrane protein